MGILVCWCWGLCREGPSADSSRIQSPRAQGCAPAAERSQTPLWNRSWFTGIFSSQHYRLQQQQYQRQRSPSEWEKSSKTAFRSTAANSVGHLAAIGLWKPSSSHTLPSCPYAIATLSLLPNQALCRFYQHPLNTSPTTDITRFPFTASSTLCSPDPLSAAQMHLPVWMRAEQALCMTITGSTCWEQAGISLQPKQMERAKNHTVKPKLSRSSHKHVPRSWQLNNW